MSDVHPLIGFRLRQIPVLSQRQLADLLGVSRETIWRWETGARKIEASRLPQIAELTGIPARELRPDLADLLE